RLEKPIRGLSGTGYVAPAHGRAIQTRGRLGQHRANLATATRFRDPGHPQPPEPGSRAAGSSPRTAGRNVARSGSIVGGRTNRVLITTFVLWAEANKQSSKHPTA